MKLSVYRYNPETDAKPYMQDFDVAACFSRVSLVSGKSGIGWPNEQDLSAYTLEAGLRPLSC